MQCGRVQVPSSKLYCSHILVRPRDPAFINGGLESRGDSSGGGDSQKEAGEKGARCSPSWSLKQGQGPTRDRGGRGGWLRLLLLHRK